MRPILWSQWWSYDVSLCNILLSFLQDSHELQHLQTLNTVDTDSLLNQQEVVTTIDYSSAASSEHLVPPHPTVPSATTQLSHQGSGDLVQQLERLQQQNMLHSLTDASASSQHEM